ncbi:citrate transporter [Faecalibacterium sp. An58]|uniref:SLC13 family permease n=1 Tax=Faecalibacterium sp. An58 TaxID=1965648 RepID=UPI000B3A0380|nr:SLC13 family permease [Faecalibacterium sp. An58]OUN73105.1 citrate transporter [Faecalibacterium sp. An58]
MTKLIRFIKQEAVLSVAAVLALLSAFFVPPDGAYLGYIDFRTLAILFSLMTVMAGLRQQGIFDRMGRALLALTGSTLQLVLVLVGLCFFGSMFITNDVSLLTFVPFTFVVLNSLGAEAREKLILPVVCMQTIAANLGSMLTPIGNPQNLYLYGRSGMGMGAFVALMLPYTLASLALLAGWAVWLCRGGSPVRKGTGGPFLAPQQSVAADGRIIWMDAALFVVCLLAVVRVLPYPVAFGAVLAATLLADRATLGRVDYSLLLTFVAFFIFIGNLGRVEAFSDWLRQIIAGREVLVAVLASQVTSNVPAALLLSGFTQDVQALIIGTNLGGLGTLIASMASLISYRQIAREEPAGKGRYFALFTLSNLLFLAVLLGLWAILA